MKLKEKKPILKRIKDLFCKRQSINEEMKIQDEWYATAKNIKYKDLFKFINRLMKKYNHDYGTICHALAAGAVATVNAMNRTEQGGITGFQASGVMWEFLEHFMGIKPPVKIVQYKNMLYPNYEKQFEKIIIKETFEYLQKEAEKLLIENESAHIEVKKHWQSIINGVVPFGYEIMEDD